MTTFTLKLTATFTMVLDHLGQLVYQYLGECSDFLGLSAGRLAELCQLLRGVGRAAFPLYAFLMVQGICHTRDRQRYFLRLALLGVVSQLPFTLLSQRSLVEESGIALWDARVPGWSGVLLVLGLFSLAVLWLPSLRSPALTLGQRLLLTAFVLVGLVQQLSWDGILLLGVNKNILYTLLSGFTLCLFLRRESRDLRSLPLLLLLLLLGKDYQLWGVALPVLLFLAQDRRLGAVVVLGWGVLAYSLLLPGQGNPWDWLGLLLAAGGILLHSGARGRDDHRLFYLAYPLHLTLLGVVNLLLLRLDG